MLSKKVVVMGGLMSYSLYMTHALIISDYLSLFWGREPQSLPLRLGVLLLIVVALLTTAAVFYFYIEEPANKKLRHLLKNRFPATFFEKRPAPSPAPLDNLISGKVSKD